MDDAPLELDMSAPSGVPVQIKNSPASRRHQRQDPELTRAFSTIISHWFTSWERSREIARRDTETLQSALYLRMANFLNSFPQDSVLTHVMTVTRNLLDVLVKEHGGIRTGGIRSYGLLDTFQKIRLPQQRLATWWAAVRQSNTFSIVEKSAEWVALEETKAEVERAILDSYFQDLDSLRRRDALLQHWASSELWPRTGIRRSMLLSSTTSHVTQIQQRHSPIPFNSLFECLKEYSDHQNKLTERLCSLLRAGDGIQKLIELLDMLKSHGLQFANHIMCQEINNLLKLNRVKEAFTLFQSCPLVPLEHCPELAESAILDSQINLDAVFYERHHRQPILFKLYQERGRKVRQRIQHLRVELLQRMALACARAPDLPSQVAFRMVFKCWLIFKRHRAEPGLVQPGMTRALTEAGIVRPLLAKEPLTESRMRWIFRQVGAVEGREIMGKLDTATTEWRNEVSARIAEIRQLERSRRADEQWREQMAWNSARPIESLSSPTEGDRAVDEKRSLKERPLDILVYRPLVQHHVDPPTPVTPNPDVRIPDSPGDPNQR